jgi:hypothetical protein
LPGSAGSDVDENEMCRAVASDLLRGFPENLGQIPGFSDCEGQEKQAGNQRDSPLMACNG